MLSNILHNEKELLKNCATGDVHAFRILFDFYWDRMFANVLQFMKSEEVAQDITQELFVRIWVNREKLQEIENFSSYLYTVSKNMVMDEFKKRVLPIIHEDFYDFYLSDNSTVQDQLEFKDKEKQIYKAIDSLPPQMQQAFKLSRFEGLTHEQIAKQMNITKITSQNYIARAIVHIRKYLNNHSD